jgi:hypothetical protein
LHTGRLEAPAPLPDNTRVRTMPRALAIVLLLGGIGHSGGIAYFYATTGVPEANRVLLDFRIPPLVYLAASLLVLVWLVRGRAVSLDSRAGERSGGRHAP